MAEWKLLETAKLKQTIIVSRHDWEGPTTVYWMSERAKASDLANWTDPPTHWLDMADLPNPPPLTVTRRLRNG